MYEPGANDTDLAEESQPVGRRGAKPMSPSKQPVKVPSASSLAATLSSLSPRKQAQIGELWPGLEIELENGLTVTARSKKEYRRLIKPIDQQVLDWFSSFEAGDVLYDIGANCGTLTLTAGAMHRGHINIVAIEPGFANFESLARNLSHNGMLGFVIPLQVAVLDRTGLEAINYNTSTRAGMSLHAVGRPADHEGREFTPIETQMIPTYALDDLIGTLSLPNPTRVKIDIDGYEEALLRGAAKTLGRGSIRELLIEVVDHDRAGTRLSSLQHLLANNGYDLAQTFRHHADDSDSFVGDYLFRHRDLEGSSPQAPTPEAPPGPSH